MDVDARTLNQYIAIANVRDWSFRLKLEGVEAAAAAGAHYPLLLSLGNHCVSRLWISRVQMTHKLCLMRMSRKRDVRRFIGSCTLLVLMAIGEQKVS